MVLRTLNLHDKHFSTNTCYTAGRLHAQVSFEHISKRQSRIIFVEMYLKNNNISAEHRNI